MPTEPTDDIDDLLNFDDDDLKPVPAEERAAIDFSGDEPPAEDAKSKKVSPATEILVTPEQQRILDLEAELEHKKLHPTDETGRPLPDDDLTPDQLRIRELEDQLAAKNAKELTDYEPEFMAPSEGETITIHVVEDGFTALGEVWYRGQELIFGPEEYKLTLDKNGKSWLDLDVDAQWDKWGMEMFRHGPWRGRRWDEVPIPGDIPAAERPAYQAAVREAAAKEAARSGRIPVRR